MFRKINNLSKKHSKTFILLVVFMFFSIILKSQIAVEQYYRALAHEEYNELHLAQEELKIAISLDKNNLVYKLYLGKLYFADKEYQKALEQFYSAEKIRSNYASLELSKVYSVLNNVDSAVYFLKQYLGYYKKISKSEIKNDPAFENIIYNEKWEKLWLKNYYSLPEQMLLEAQYSYNYSNKTEALLKTNSIIKKYKKFAPAYSLKADILVQGKNYDKALKSINKSVSLNPRKPKYYQQRAEIYVFLKKYDKAIVDFQKYVSLNPYDIKVFKDIANAYALNKEYQKSLEVLLFYTKFFNKDYDAFYKMAEINYKAGNFLTTIRILNNLFDETKPESKYFQLRALAYMNANSHELAHHDFSQVLDLNPSSTNVYYYRGIVNLKMDKIENACSDWKKAIENKDYRANDYFYKYCRDY